LKTVLRRVYKNGFVKFVIVFTLLYFFLSAISMMSTAFKLLGKDFSQGLVNATSSPIVALFIGIITTAIVQSSSVTTSMVVGLVSAGTLSVVSAVPIVMGANIGTTVTSYLVATGYMGHKHEFRRAFAGATIHDVFNVLTVVLLFPLEMATGILRKGATLMATMFYGTTDTAIVYNSPIKTATKVIPKFIKHLLIHDWHVPEKITGIICLVVAFALIFVALFYLVKVMRTIMLDKVEKMLNKFLNRSAMIAITIGCLITMMVQSSSITTSLLVPMLGAGIISLEAAFPVALGANIGTTITALLASLAGNMAGLTIAFVHLLFNIAGITMIYPVRRIRRLPLLWAATLAKHTSRNKKIALYYVLGLFFLMPGLFIFIDKLL